MKTKKSGKRSNHSLSVKMRIVTGIALVLFVGYFLYGQMSGYIAGQRAGALSAVQEHNATKSYGWQVRYPKLGDTVFDEKIARIVSAAKAGFLAQIDFDKDTIAQNDLNISYEESDAGSEKIKVVVTIRKVIKKQRSQEAHEILFDRIKGEIVQRETHPKKDLEGDAVTKGDITTSEQGDCKEKKCLALTFDGGPSQETGGVLDTLKAWQAKATFFVQGAQVNRHPETVKRIAAEGHELGNGTYFGRNLQTLSDKEAAGELNATALAVREVVGKAPSIARAPFASMSPRLAKRLGLPFVGWDIETNTWNMPYADQQYNHVLAGVKEGGIVKASDTNSVTVDAYTKIIPELKKRGYEFVTVSQLLEFDDATPPGMY